MESYNQSYFRRCSGSGSLYWEHSSVRPAEFDFGFFTIILGGVPALYLYCPNEKARRLLTNADPAEAAARFGLGFRGADFLASL